MSPVYVLAGQSNAQAIHRSIDEQLSKLHGEGGYKLISVYSAGAPLSYARSKLDWSVDTELTADLLAQTTAALSQDKDAVFGGAFWFQGEADTHSVGRPDAYSDLLVSLVDDLWSAVADVATSTDTAKFSVVTLSDLAPDATSREHWQDIKAEQLDAATKSDAIQVVDLDAVFDEAGLSNPYKDGLHYADDAKPLIAQAAVASLATPHDDEDAAKDDLIFGKRGDDVLSGGIGSDEIHGRNGQDTLRGGADDDLLFGGRASDTLVGGAGEDEIRGGVQRDLLKGGGGGDDLRGGNGADTLFGGLGQDTLSGGRGADVLEGGQGGDVLIGGLGKDVFVFTTGRGGDVIKDFSSDDNDKIDLSSYRYFTAFEDVMRHLHSDEDGDAVIDLSPHHALTLSGVAVSEISESDFIL